MSDSEAAPTTYAVVINIEEQYSIWPAQADPPAGWSRTGVSGTREACLSHIEQVWTDIRPLSVRRSLAEAGRELAPAERGA